MCLKPALTLPVFFAMSGLPNCSWGLHHLSKLGRIYFRAVRLAKHKKAVILK